MRQMETVRPANSLAKLESTALPARFLWIQSDGLQQTQVTDGKPQSQRYSTAARKHVMRGEWTTTEAAKIYTHQECKDIGYSRQLRKRKRTSVVKFELAVVRRPQSSPIEPTSNTIQPSISARSTLQQIPADLESGRLDPFVRWPVNITKRMRWLLDHCALL